jgi:hypothetical protein
MELHTCDLDEFYHMLPHVYVTLEKTHVPNFPLEAFQNFELYLVSDGC